LTIKTFSDINIDDIVDLYTIDIPDSGAEPDKSTMYTLKENIVKNIIDEYFYYSIYRNKDGKLLLTTPDRQHAMETLQRLNNMDKNGLDKRIDG